MSWKDKFPRENRYFETENGILYYCDNLTLLKTLPKGFIRLIYIDPPYGIPRDKVFELIRWNSTEEHYKFCDSLGLSIIRRIDKKGKRSNWGIAHYLYWIYERLVLMKEVLADDGTIYVHLDYRMVHYVKIVMDEIFGRENFRNEIIWCYRGGGTPEKDFALKHDVILRYSKTDNYIFNLDDVRIPYSQETLERLQYEARAFRGNRVYEGYRPHEKGKHPEDWWLLQPLMPSDKERIGYPTQKPERLLKRIILASSNEGDIVADFFCGSGTFVVVAEKLKRKWICCDKLEQAVSITKKRLLSFK